MHVCKASQIVFLLLKKLNGLLSMSDRCHLFCPFSNLVLMVSPGHLVGPIRHYIPFHYITLHEDPDHLEQSSHDASNICEDTEHERNPDDSEEEAEQAAAEGAGCKVAVA